MTDDASNSAPIFQSEGAIPANLFLISDLLLIYVTPISLLLSGYEFSKAIGVFTLALGCTVAFILLTICCCCCCKCCCWSEKVQQRDRAAQRRKMINALRKDGRFETFVTLFYKYHVCQTSVR